MMRSLAAAIIKYTYLYSTLFDENDSKKARKTTTTTTTTTDRRTGRQATMTVERTHNRGRHIKV